MTATARVAATLGATRRKGLTYRDTVVLITPEPRSSDREEAHHG